MGPCKTETLTTENVQIKAKQVNINARYQEIISEQTKT
jgi:hypothetical protein